MTLYEYTGQSITNTKALRDALIAEGESTPVYTVVGDYVSVETITLTESQVDNAVAGA